MCCAVSQIIFRSIVSQIIFRSTVFQIIFGSTVSQIIFKLYCKIHWTCSSEYCSASVILNLQLYSWELNLYLIVVERVEQRSRGGAGDVWLTTLPVSPAGGAGRGGAAALQRRAVLEKTQQSDALSCFLSMKSSGAAAIRLAARGTRVAGELRRGARAV
jgi:hypothetical protein